ncbi:PHP domain-containing protein [Methanobrevibacter sp. OttesenSCG-928-I08]|nr:PHP domain-containing protein [Methanobrevibacter sp. OttesenSCG-928-I08]
MKLDSHIHSSYSSDSSSKIEDILNKSRNIGLDIIGISDHDTIEGSKIAIKESQKYEDILVIPSIEISSASGHILGFGVEEKVPMNLSPDETIDRIHELGGLAIIPHPYSFYRYGLFHKVEGEKLKVDAIEILNAKYFLGYGNYKSEKHAKKQSIPEIGASDAHKIEYIGDCFTEIECEMNIDSVLKNIKKGKVKACGKGTSYLTIYKNKIIKKVFK